VIRAKIAEQKRNPEPNKPSPSENCLLLYKTHVLFLLQLFLEIQWIQDLSTTEAKINGPGIFPIFKHNNKNIMMENLSSIYLPNSLVTKDLIPSAND
jgi:hypothetical protein